MTDKQILKKALEYGIVDITTLREKVELKDREYLNGHKIWQGKNGKWYTKMEIDDHVKLIKRVKKGVLEDFIINYERDKVENPIVRDVFYQFLEQKFRYHDISKSTYDRYEADFDRYIKGTKLEKMHFKDITEEFLEEYIRCRVADLNLTYKCYANLRTIIRGMLLYAKGKFTTISARSFFGDLQFSRNTFKRTALKREEQVFSEEETDILLSYLKDIDSLYSYGVQLAFLTGVRVGELVAIKKEDIIYERDCISIHIQRTETKYKVGTRFIMEVKDYPKSFAGDRYVVCTDDAADLIDRINAINDSDEWLFENERGRFHDRMFDGALRKFCRDCGIPEKSMHKIRKTYGTTLIDGGVDEAIIIDQMGHSDISCTKQYYYYSTKNRVRQKEQLSIALSRKGN